MLSALEIKSIDFTTGLRGYKTEEVDVFLDKVEADYLQFERLIKDYTAKIEQLETEVENFKSAQNSIQNVLLNAQKLADHIVNEAKEKSEEIISNAEKNIIIITEKEKELAEAFERKANERKAALKLELEQMVEKENLKAQSIVKASEDAVKRQQVLFDKLKLEIVAFKSSVTSKYKEHLNILQEIPDTVDMTPQEMADIISAKIDQIPKAEDFIETKPQLKSETVSQEKMEDVSSGFSLAEEIEE